MSYTQITREMSPELRSAIAATIWQRRQAETRFINQHTGFERKFASHYVLKRRIAEKQLTRNLVLYGQSERPRT